MALIELLLIIIGLMLAIAEWNRTIKRATTINSWNQVTHIAPYIEDGEPYVLTSVFHKERHYHIKSMRITCFHADKTNLGNIMLRIEDQNGWLVPNFVFDKMISHDAIIYSDDGGKTWSLKATIESDGFYKLKFFCYNRTGKPLNIRIETLLKFNYTVGDAIHYFFTTWFPTLSVPIILLLTKIKGIATLLRIRI